MKLKLFFILSALVAAGYAVANPFLTDSASTLPVWSVIVAVGAFIRNYSIYCSEGIS